MHGTVGHRAQGLWVHPEQRQPPALSSRRFTVLSKGYAPTSTSTSPPFPIRSFDLRPLIHLQSWSPHLANQVTSLSLRCPSRPRGLEIAGDERYISESGVGYSAVLLYDELQLHSPLSAATSIQTIHTLFKVPPARASVSRHGEETWHHPGSQEPEYWSKMGE